MANSLFIHKTGDNKFWHRHNSLVATDFVISDFEISLDGNKFNIIQNDGATRFTYLVQNISLQVLGGAIEVGFTPASLYDRLVEIGYTPFYTITGLTANELEAIHGAAAPSASNPFATIADVGGGGSGFGGFIVWDGISTITVPSGYGAGKILNYNNGELPTYTVVGTTLTITGGADAENILIFNP